MGWFKRSKQGVVTPTNKKKETPEGLWYKCPECKTVISNEEYVENLNVCAKCSHHGRIASKAYFKLLFFRLVIFLKISLFLKNGVYLHKLQNLLLVK